MASGSSNQLYLVPTQCDIGNSTTTSNKEFHDIRMESGSLDKLYYISKPLDMGRDDFGGYTNQEDQDSDSSIAPTTFDKEFHETTVQRIVQNYTDKIMLVLEDISSRLSRVELCCNNLVKTIGEMRSDLTHEGEEADLKTIGEMSSTTSSEGSRGLTGPKELC